MALANVVVTVNEPDVSVSSDNVNVSVASTSTNVTVSSATVTSNGDIRSSISVSNVSGFGNLTYDSGAGSNGVIQYTGVSTTDIRGLFSNTSPIQYNSATGVIGFDQQLNDLTLVKYQETVIDNGTQSGNVSVDIATGTIHKLTTSGNITGLTLNNISTGGSATILITQGGGGGNQIDTTTHPSNWTSYEFVNQGKTIDENPGNFSVINIFYDGSKFFTSITQEQALQVQNSDLANSSITLNDQVINLGDTTTLAKLTDIGVNNTDVNAAFLGFRTGDLNSQTDVGLIQGTGNIQIKNGEATNDFTKFIGQTQFSNVLNLSSGAVLETTNNINITGTSPGDKVIRLVDANIDMTHAGANIEGLTSNSVVEGTNLYFTNARANSAIGAYQGNISTVGTITAGAGPLSTHNFTGNVDIAGNITATGNINYQNVTDLFVTDQKITLNANATTDATVEVISNRPQSTYNAKLTWNEPSEVWTFMNGDNTFHEMLTSTQARGLISTTTASASGGGSLAYDNSSGVFTFAPADLTSKIELTDLSVTQASATGTGALAYNNGTGVFTYTPPDLSAFGLTNAQAQSFIQSNGLTMTSAITSNSVISTTGNLQVNADTPINGLKGLTFDNTNNFLGIGTTTPGTLLDGNSEDSAIHIQCLDQFHGTLSIEEARSTTSGPEINFFKAWETGNVLAAVASGNRLGEIHYEGFDGTEYIDRHFHNAFVDGTVSTGVMPVGWEIRGDGAGTATNKSLFKVRGNGALQVGIMNNDDSDAGMAFQVDSGGNVDTTGSIVSQSNVESTVRLIAPSGVFGAFTINANSITGATDIAASGNVSGTKLSDGVLQITGGNISLIHDVDATGHFHAQEDIKSFGSDLISVLGNVEAQAGNVVGVYLHGDGSNITNTSGTTNTAINGYRGGLEDLQFLNLPKTGGTAISQTDGKRGTITMQPVPWSGTAYTPLSTAVPGVAGTRNTETGIRVFMPEQNQGHDAQLAGNLLPIISVTNEDTITHNSKIATWGLYYEWSNSSIAGNLVVAPYSTGTSSNGYQFVVESNSTQYGDLNVLPGGSNSGKITSAGDIKTTAGNVFVGNVSLTNDSTLNNVNTINSTAGTDLVLDPNTNNIVIKKTLSGASTTQLTLANEGWAPSSFITQPVYNGASVGSNIVLVAWVIEGTTTAGSNVINVTTATEFQDAYGTGNYNGNAPTTSGRTTALSGVSGVLGPNMLARGNGALTSGAYPFPNGAKIQSIDSSANTITMDVPANETATLSWNSGGTDTKVLFFSGGAYGSASVNPEYAETFYSKYDFKQIGYPSAEKDVLAFTEIAAQDEYGFGQSGPQKSANDIFFTNGLSNDYTQGTYRTRGRIGLEGNKSFVQTNFGISVGANSSVTNRINNDPFSGFGYTQLWDGTENYASDFGVTTAVPQIGTKQYTDGSAQATQPYLGTRLQFNSAYGQITDNPQEWYPRTGQEIGRVGWWGSHGDLENPSSIAAPAYISVQAADNWTNGSNASMYFVATSDYSKTYREPFISYEKGNLILAGGNVAGVTQNITFAPAKRAQGSGADPAGTYNFVGGPTSTAAFGTINYANTSANSGAEFSVNNGGSLGAGTVGDMQISLHRKDNTYTANVSATPTGFFTAASGGVGTDIIYTATGVVEGTGNAYTFSGITDANWTFLNGNTYAFSNYVAGSQYKEIRNLDGSAVAQGGADVAISAGSYEYVASQASGVTDKEWSLTLAEQSEDLVLKGNTTTQVTFTDSRTTLNSSLKLKSYTTTEINALASPQAGDSVYNSTLNQICFYNGTAWQKVTSANM